MDFIPSFRESPLQLSHLCLRIEFSCRLCQTPEFDLEISSDSSSRKIPRTASRPCFSSSQRKPQSRCHSWSDPLSKRNHCKRCEFGARNVFGRPSNPLFNMAATPPPPSPSSLRIPAAPRHGSGYDQYEPYPTRCSARIANQRASRVADKTPEPMCPSSPHKARSKQAARKYQTIEVDADEMFSAPGKSSKSYIRKRTGASVPSIAFDDYDLSSRTSHSPNPRSRTTVNQALPTPAKTPSKRKLSSSDISSASRTLFPTQSTRPKKSTPLSLESFEAPASKTIQIYTDSRDKIPKPVTDMETPFNAKAGDIVSSGSVEVPKAGKRARKQDKPNDGNVRYKQYDEHDQYGRDDISE